MARARKIRTLGVWMNGEKVGLWHTPASGRSEFRYAPTWFESPHARPISLSIPLGPPDVAYRKGVGEYFDNLLPDSREIRERVQRRSGAASDSAFDLLCEIGRDCVGAIQLLPEEDEPGNVRVITGDRLTSSGVAEILDETLGKTPIGVGDTAGDFRISIAGAQEKTALLLHEGAWHRPTGATPSTHILKLPIGQTPFGIDLSTSVENEWICAQVVNAYGLATAECRMETFGEYRTLVVARFDRRLAADRTWWMRIPQEDFCQATGTSPNRKYEAEGGPGIERIMRLLLGSEEPEADRREFLATQLVFWLLAATDGHAKNFSVFLNPQSRFRLTPRYDVLSAHPFLGHGRGKLSPQKIKMAMAVWGKNRHCRWSEIALSHWLETAKSCGFRGMAELVREVVDRTPGAVDEVRKRIPQGFPGEIAEPILTGVAAAAKELGAATAGKAHR